MSTHTRPGHSQFCMPIRIILKLIMMGDIGHISYVSYRKDHSTFSTLFFFSLSLSLPPPPPSQYRAYFVLEDISLPL